MTEDEVFKEDAAWWAANYTGEMFHFGEREKNEKIRDRGVRACRFCGRGAPSVTFQKDAHAVSTFLGNVSLFSMNECDRCNELFGNGAEDHLSKFDVSLRAIGQVPKRDGFPAFDNKRLRIENKKEFVISESVPGQILDDGIDQLFFEAESQQFIPQMAYKALIKYACPSSRQVHGHNELNCDCRD